MQQVAGIQNQQGCIVNHNISGGMETGGEEDGPREKDADGNSESIQVEENEFLDFDFCS